MLTSNIVIVRLPWERDSSFGGVYRGLASDLVRRVAERDPFEAAQLLKQHLTGKPCVPSMTERFGPTDSRPICERRQILRWCAGRTRMG